MVDASHALHEVEPREQVGARTGALYEYQYHQAAAEALALLDDTNAVCIYCEWHDDYVTEVTIDGCYAFHQVKTRQKSKGPWRLAEFFGLEKKTKQKPEPAASADSIFAHLWDHTQKFGNRCARFVFVTDSGIDGDMGALLTDAKTVKIAADLPSNSSGTFNKLQQQLSRTFSGITALIPALRKRKLESESGVHETAPSCRYQEHRSGSVPAGSSRNLSIADRGVG